MKEDEFKCHICKKIFKKGLTDGEAEKQLGKEFGELVLTEECEIVCDDCFGNMLNYELK